MAIDSGFQFNVSTERRGGKQWKQTLYATDWAGLKQQHMELLQGIKPWPYRIDSKMNDYQKKGDHKLIVCFLICYHLSAKWANVDSDSARQRLWKRLRMYLYAYFVICTSELPPLLHNYRTYVLGKNYLPSWDKGCWRTWVVTWRCLSKMRSVSTMILSHGDAHRTKATSTIEFRYAIWYLSLCFQDYQTISSL